MKRLGNRTLLLVHNGLNVIFVMMMTFSFRVPLLFFIFLYLNSFVNALSIVYNQAMHSEVKDYQQYISGKRMDFMFGVAGLIATPVTMLTGLVIPYAYECMGLTTNYDILYDPNVRNTMFYILCLLSIVGAVMNLIPFSFYSLSREKHRNIIKVLRYRAVSALLSYCRAEGTDGGRHGLQHQGWAGGAEGECDGAELQAYRCISCPL